MSEDQGPQSLTGVWNGLYTYSNGLSVSFVATLIDSGSALSGTTHEPNVLGTTPGGTLTALLAGGRQGGAISFVKIYDEVGPRLYYPVHYEGALNGDATDEGVLSAYGHERAIAVVVTFSDKARALGAVRAVRRRRREVPILVRAVDDTNLEALLEAGATEVVPETLEAALTLVGNTLHMLDVPASRVIRRLGDIRAAGQGHVHGEHDSRFLQ